jgi:short-subunit dehydrogenase
MAVINLLITGASSGLGAALARVYAQEGARMILWGRDEQRLSATAMECRERGALVETESFDLCDIDHMIARIRFHDEQTPIDLAFLNAGLGGEVPKGEVAESIERSHQMVGVNFTAPVVAATTLAHVMGNRGCGHIVLVGSLGEYFPLPMAPTYSGTKTGLAIFAEALWLMQKKRGVAVTLVSPGFVDTPMSGSLTSPKPFMISADDAARRIAKKIVRRPRRIAFPWPLAFICAAARFLPRSIIAAVLRRV